MYRRSGRTTRLVDKAIQCFFTEGAVFFPISFKDRDYLWPLEGTKYHPYRPEPVNIVFMDGETLLEQRHILDIFLRRLIIEHGLTYTGPRLPVGRILRLQDFEQGKQNMHYLTFWDVLKMKFTIWKLKIKYGRV